MTSSWWSSLRTRAWLLLLIAVVATGCASSDLAATNATAEVSETTSSTTVVESTTTSTPPTTSTSSTSSTVPPVVLPIAVDNPGEFLDAARQRAFDGGPVETRVQTRTGPVDFDGRHTKGERLTVVNSWDGDQMSGFALFNGPGGISSRGAGDQALVAALLIFGSTYSYDGEWLVVERQLFSKAGNAISSDGDDWVKVHVDSLNEYQGFALRLLAPFDTGYPEVVEYPETYDEELLLVERRGDWEVYSYSFSAGGQESEAQFLIDADGAMRDMRTEASFLGGFLLLQQTRPIDASEIRLTDHEGLEDVTEQFKAYADRRYEESPQSLDG